VPEQFTLEELGWRTHLEAELEKHPGAIPGRIAVEHRSAYVVLTERGEQWAEVAGRLRHHSPRAALPAVGDWVACRMEPGESAGTITAVLPRWSKFSRHGAGVETDEQVLAANIDMVWITQALDRDLNSRRLERYLAMTWAGGADPAIVLTKSDTCDDPQTARLSLGVAAAGAAVFITSSVTGEGLDELAALLRPGRTIALLGSSGVGKSTLVNSLAGAEVMKTAELRGDGRGRHTTTHRELHLLPGRGLIVDTPGMREMQLWDDAGSMETTFADIAALAEACRFRDCAHASEPGCAVTAAVADGSLGRERLQSYHKLQRELRHLALKRDQRAAAEERRKMRAFSRSLRKASR
jgi:ribosome biogenesis GTPase / thiamine phosphate phosphatase